MTRQGAIDFIEQHCMGVDYRLADHEADSDWMDAMKMAIEALERDIAECRARLKGN